VGRYRPGVYVSVMGALRDARPSDIHVTARTKGGLREPALPNAFWAANNQDVEKVKRTLTYLVHGSGDFVQRLHDVLYAPSMKLDQMVSEIGRSAQGIATSDTQTWQAPHAIGQNSCAKVLAGRRISGPRGSRWTAIAACSWPDRRAPSRFPRRSNRAARSGRYRSPGANRRPGAAAARQTSSARDLH